MKIRVGHLYPDYLNIYADRGNIAVFARRAALRGHELDVTAISVGDELRPGEHDLLYIGGGQDREQALIAPDLAEKGPAIEEAVDGGAALLAVCGGYQLLGRGYLDRHGASLPGVGLFPHDTVAGERRMIGDVLLECELVPGRAPDGRGFREPRRPDAARPRCRAARPRRRRLRERRRVGLRGRAASAARSAPTCTARCSRATPGSRTGSCRRRSPTRRAASRRQLEPLPDRLEAEAHAVSAQRARRRGGRY